MLLDTFKGINFATIENRKEREVKKNFNCLLRWDRIRYLFLLAIDKFLFEALGKQVESHLLSLQFGVRTRNFYTIFDFSIGTFVMIWELDLHFQMLFGKFVTLYEEINKCLIQRNVIIILRTLRQQKLIIEHFTNTSRCNELNSISWILI